MAAIATTVMPSMMVKPREVASTKLPLVARRLGAGAVERQVAVGDVRAGAPRRRGDEERRRGGRHVGRCGHRVVSVDAVGVAAGPAVLGDVQAVRAELL